jgi:hypothetical protein
LVTYWAIFLAPDGKFDTQVLGQSAILVFLKKWCLRASKISQVKTVKNWSFYWSRFSPLQAQSRELKKAQL